jgi:hypothetical protein
MASNIIGHSAFPKVMAGAVVVGIGLILIGALAGKSVAVIAGLCGSGSALTLVAGFGIAVKIDHYFKKKRMETELVTPYTPAYIYNTNKEGWDELNQKAGVELDKKLRENAAGVNIRYGMKEDKHIRTARLDFDQMRNNRGLIGDKEL